MWCRTSPTASRMAGFLCSTVRLVNLYDTTAMSPLLAGSDALSATRASQRQEPKDSAGDAGLPESRDELVGMTCCHACIAQLTLLGRWLHCKRRCLSQMALKQSTSKDAQFETARCGLAHIKTAATELPDMSSASILNDMIQDLSLHCESRGLQMPCAYLVRAAFKPPYQHIHNAQIIFCTRMHK